MAMFGAGLDALFARDGGGGGGGGPVNAGSTLSDMFAEDHRVEASQRGAGSGVFTLEQFVELRAEMNGFFEGACVPLTVTESQGVFSAMYDPATRVMKVAQELPVESHRTAAEICKVAQYTSLLRDGEGKVGDWQFLCKVIATHVGWSYAWHCLHPQDAVGNFLTSGEDEEMFAVWKELAPAERVARLVKSMVRWEDEDACVGVLAKIAPMLGCVTEYVMAHEAKPLVPFAYVGIEAARQRLIRSVIDGNTPTVVASIQKTLRKKLSRECASEEGIDEALEPYLPPTAGGPWRAVLDLPAAEFTPEDYARLLQLEGIVGDLTRPRGGGTLSI